MRRYLLFDAQCDTCARMAAEVQRASVRVTTRPLVDLDVQALLQRAHPSWRWEPTLLEVEYGVRIRVSTGRRMRLRLLRLLGVRRSAELWGRARRLPPPRARPEPRAPRLLEAVATALMSPEFSTIQTRLATTCPQDAWHEPEAGRYLIVFNIVSGRTTERLAAFMVSDAPNGRVLSVSEIVVEATEEGWRARNLGGNSRSTDSTAITAQAALVTLQGGQ